MKSGSIKDILLWEKCMKLTFFFDFVGSEDINSYFQFEQVL